MKRFKIIKNIVVDLILMILIPILWPVFWVADRSQINPIHKVYADIWSDIKWEFSKWQ